jgi:putative hydrolase of the HAD superfamily
LKPIQDRIEILKPLKKNGYKLFILSNFIEEAFKHVIEQYDFFSQFDGRVISYEEKVIKPEKAIYDILVNRYNLIPQECVFLDDHSSFLKPAKQLGMATILVHQNTDLKEEFRKINIVF